MITFYLSRNPMSLYDGSYKVTSYVPKRHDHGAPCWWYYPNTAKDFTLCLRSEDIDAILKKLGKEVEPGTCVNLTTGDVVRLEDAPKLFPTQE